MGRVSRVLDAAPIASLAEYQAGEGGEALDAARSVEPQALIEVVEASGLRGRGGGGFPTGTKWRTVAGLGGDEPPTVVVNAAEGEPGTFKDRAILRTNPFRVLEGALIAARAVGADRIIIGMKESAVVERSRVTAAVAAVVDAGWTKGVRIDVVADSERYLLGEESALLEVIADRPPFPRLAPPYRAGAEPVGDDTSSRAGTDLADAVGATDAAPTLVNNVETLANVPAVVLKGPEAFRLLGTERSPGTIVCTVTGCTERAGVGEFELGTPLREVIDTLGGGLHSGSRLVAVLSGTANPLLPASAVDTLLTWEDLEAAGGGLGSAGFIVIDDSVDIVAVAHGVSRFLAVESCGQCTPCKQDGLAITELLDGARRSDVDDGAIDALRLLTRSVTDGARCFLAQQHQNVVDSLLTLFREALEAHRSGRAGAADEFPIVPLRDIVDGEAVLDLDQLDLAPDWGHGPDTGATPADRIDVRAART